MELRKLPDAEFEIMRAVWNAGPAVTAPMLTAKLSEELPERDWKAQTVTTMLTRLEKKGFLRSKKTGKERDFFPAISEQEYFSLEAEGFRSRFKKSSLSSLVKALSGGESISKEDADELRRWLDEV